MGKGYRLKSLGDYTFESDGQAFTKPIINSPKAIRRVHEIFDRPSFLEDKVIPSDIKQGSVKDSWLMATLTSLANIDVGIGHVCVERGNKVAPSNM